MTQDNLAFIGGGNMARSLIGGLVARGRAAASIHVAEPQESLRQALAADFGVQVHATASEAARDAGTWVLSVKPQVMRAVCTELAPLAAGANPLVVSIAAGVTTAQMDEWLGGGQAVVRTMPNTPSLLGAGATGLYANPRVTNAGREMAGALMSAVGLAAWIPDEAQMDADMLSWVAGERPTRVYAELAQRKHASHEDLLFGLLHFPSGASGMLDVNWLTPAKRRQLVVIGEEGMFELDYLTHSRAASTAMAENYVGLPY